MRIAHITDLHIECPPALTELASKRLIGAVNLYILGRSHHFSIQSQEALVRAVQALAPGAVVCTGDISATATDAEFTKARQLLSPILEHIPTLMITGNHDVYTGESAGRFQRYFGEWMGDSGPLPSRHFAGMQFMALDVCHFDWLSRGQAGDALTHLDQALQTGESPIALMLHYPLRDRKGQPYGPWTRALSDAALLEQRLLHPRIQMILHGHEHHGFRTHLSQGERTVPIFNPGASGYAYLPDRHRTAHFNVYTIEEGKLLAVERYTFNGQDFVPEPGGPYASGG